ncbi:phage tail tape measure protein [Laribacter hongkongensis]|uniref:phage tail tape measure protein n=1 Tax=Laribacter hongkongensis TaxID=168471 RepID=UPI001EFCB61A|nr:phage tail tape measure protein [Laribacter hongkongensis]MCG9074281.1 phage tail tape measure protein [Laribacter hongkongensis]
MTDEIAKGVVAVEVDATGVEAGINRAVRSIDTLGANASRSGDQAAAGIQKIGTGGDAAARRVEMSTKSIVAQIQRVTAEMESGGRNTRQYFEALASQRGLDANALKPYLDQLDKVSASHVRTGLSAKEMSFALRGVPAQFTDIAVSLASGQQPLTVMLQQGGQLKDMFGGIGPAAKALGSYMVGLINPLTLTAGAVAAVSYAYYKGSEEQDAYIKALVNTNHAIGLSSSQMAMMAARMGDVSGTTAAAAESIAALAAAGVTSRAGIEKFATATSDAYKYLGKSVDDTAKAFAGLEKDPLKAAVQLDEAERFLTASVYDQIKALQQQGRAAEAASVAQNAYADKLAERTAEMKANLGLIERGWQGITSAVKQAGDAMLAIGRQQTVAEQLAAKRSELAKLESGNRGPQGGRFGKPGESEGNLRLQIEALESDLRRSATDARRDAEKEKQRREGIALRTAYDEWASANKTRKQQQSAELAEQKKFLDRKIINEEQYQRNVALINDKYKETAKKPKAYQDDEATKMLLGLSEKAASLRAQLAMPGDLTESARKLVEFNQQMDELHRKSVLTGAQKSLLSRENEIREGLKVNAGLEEEIRKKTALAKLNDETRRIADQLASQRDANNRGYERELDAVGRGDKYLAELQKITAIEDKIEEIKRNFRESEGFQFMTEEQKRLQLDRFNALGEEMVDDFRRHAASLDIANMDWTNGATKALENYTDAARNASDSTRDLFTNAFQGMEDSISEFVRTGKLSFADLTDSIIRDLIRMQVKASITGPLAGIVSGLFNSLGKNNLVDNGQLLGSMFATGGHVAGPGSGTSDSIPAWLSNGEYVIKADTVSKYGKGFFDRLNAGHFATGGLVGSSKAATSAPAQPVAVSVEVVNQTSQPVSAQAGPVKFDGEKYVQQVILSDIRRGGPISRALGSRT